MTWRETLGCEKGHQECVGNAMNAMPSAGTRDATGGTGGPATHRGGVCAWHIRGDNHSSASTKRTLRSLTSSYAAILKQNQRRLNSAHMLGGPTHDCSTPLPLSKTSVRSQRSGG